MSPRTSLNIVTKTLKFCINLLLLHLTSRSNSIFLLRIQKVPFSNLQEISYPDRL